MGSCNIGALSKIMEDRRRMDLIKAIEELRREKQKLGLFRKNIGALLARWVEMATGHVLFGI